MDPVFFRIFLAYKSVLSEDKGTGVGVDLIKLSENNHRERFDHSHWSHSFGEYQLESYLEPIENWAQMT